MYRKPYLMLSWIGKSKMLNGQSSVENSWERHVKTEKYRDNELKG